MFSHTRLTLLCMFLNFYFTNLAQTNMEYIVHGSSYRSSLSSTFCLFLLLPPSPLLLAAIVRGNHLQFISFVPPNLSHCWCVYVCELFIASEESFLLSHMGPPKNAIKSLILVLEQFCIEHFLIIFQF